MIRGILEKGTSRVKGAVVAPPADVKATASTSSTSTASSSADSSSNGSRNRPASGSEDAAVTSSGFFRDSSAPIAKSIKSASGKIFRSGDRSTSTGASAPASADSQEHPHHPQHSSSSSKTASNNNNSSSSNLIHGMAPPSATPEVRPGKKCSLCGKNFNPLRRRYFCRVCTVEVCSNCSLKRKVDSSLEGAISIRICMACKMNTSAPQSDYYDRAFSVASALHPGGDDGVFGGDVFGDGRGDRTSAVSFMSAVGPSSADRRPFSSASSVKSSSSSATATTPANYNGGNKQKGEKTPAPVPGGLRRTSSSASAQSAAQSRRDSFGSVATPAECQMCMNEACGPMVDLGEVPYPATEIKSPNGGSDRFVRARSLDNEKERLVSVRKIRRVLTASPAVAQRFAQLCSMASIATQSRVAVIALLDKDEYVVVSETGLPAAALPVSRTLALASHTCRNGAPLVCSDLGADIRFAGNPWRRDSLHALFYAGIPLTLKNGHTIGVIEVFDKHVRYACMDVVTQLQAVVRGLLKKFEEVLESAPPAESESGSEASGGAAEEDPIAVAIAALERTTSYGDMKATPTQPRSPARRAPAPTPPVAAPAPATSEPTPEPVPVSEPAPGAAPAPAAPAAPAGPTENEMEMRLMELLSQTTSTQEQLRNQQGQMVHAISSHTKQISDLAKQLERMESTLTAKLETIPPAAADTAPSKPAATESPEAVP